MSLTNPQLCHKTCYDEQAARREVAKRLRCYAKRKTPAPVIRADYCGVCDLYHINVEKALQPGAGVQCSGHGRAQHQ